MLLWLRQWSFIVSTWVVGLNNIGICFGIDFNPILKYNNKDIDSPSDKFFVPFHVDIWIWSIFMEKQRSSIFVSKYYQWVRSHNQKQSYLNLKWADREMWRLCDSSNLVNKLKILAKFTWKPNNWNCKINSWKCHWFEVAFITFIEHLWHTWETVQLTETVFSRCQTFIACFRWDMEKNWSCFCSLRSICRGYHCFPVKTARCLWYLIFC